MDMIRVVPLASPLHGEGAWRSLLDEYRRELKTIGLEVGDVVSDARDLGALGDVDLLVLVLLTGGVSRLASEAAGRGGRWVLLVAHGYQNSLPSALSARARISGMGKPVRLLFSSRPSVGALRDELEAYRAAELVRRTPVALFMADRLDEEALLFSRATGARVVPIPEARLEGEMGAVGEVEVEAASPGWPHWPAGPGSACGR